MKKYNKNIGKIGENLAEQFLKNLEKEREQSAFLKETGIPISVSCVVR